MTIQECKKLAESGMSLEVIHKMHGNTITCPVCLESRCSPDDVESLSGATPGTDSES